jgi:hypothetical protein
MDPTTELIARNIADNIILYLDKTVAPDDAQLRAAAAMNVAAILSRHAQLTEEQTIELLRRCIEADQEAQSTRKTKKPAKTEGQE